MVSISLKPDIWKFRADVAVMPIYKLDNNLAVTTMPIQMALGDETSIDSHGVGIGDEVLMVGLFSQRYGYRNIPFKTNSKAGGLSTYGAKSELWDRMFHFYNLHREEFLTHYHKRSNVETTFHMIKSKFGQRLRSKSLTAQINEALCKVLCHNLCCVIQSMHELGVDPNFGVVAA